MASHFDTIVAPITGSGSAAVVVVRISGPGAWAVASQVFSPWMPEPMRAVYGRYRHGDDGIALPFAEGHSYTGEEAVELSIHGSPASLRRLVEDCLAAGARMAEPGEFTQRAFLNGRIDLTQAEAVRDTIEARTEAQLRLANLQREGSLRRRMNSIREIVAKTLAAVEASVDFSEEIGELDRPAASARLRKAIREIEALLETAAASRILRQGVRVAIVGPPNAGKSSLLNAILGSDRAIVTEIPGTTRDFVEEQIEVGGIPVVLIDTAGLRDSDDRVESLGIQRSRAVAAGADHVWYVIDASVGASPEDDAALAALPSSTLIANKCDLAKPARGLAVSASTGAGIAELLRSLPLDRDVAHREIAINSRHAELLQEARHLLELAVATLDSDRPDDLVSVLLQEALSTLGQITGETASPDMIARIFADFCIGK
ncbi:MAG TPA: tRNA uridine-5-carboxymethylaminomethyl(34) synthesis GTPase MnmE [Fimbriimonadaceae bacterium]|nr:tRNA uridine-5-carboxymethylaminomethyl(34) synthesis GTPase MnmE [Fimbriimonadaceae bacterium]